LGKKKERRGGRKNLRQQNRRAQEFGQNRGFFIGKKKRKVPKKNGGEGEGSN